MKFKYVLWLSVLLFVFLAVTAMSSRQTGNFNQFDLEGINIGGRQNVGELIAGKTAIINIWATWCPPCRAEIPDLVEIFETYKNRNVIVLGISVDSGGRDMVKKFISDNKMTYPVLLDDGSVSKAFGVRGIPTSIFINKKGKIVDKKVGYADKQFFEEEIKKIFKTE